tara:strand:+ start:38 stop:304 length:267 start_codon:yes stop_codon:yes gene_type:complete
MAFKLKRHRKKRKKKLSKKDLLLKKLALAKKKLQKTKFKIKSVKLNNNQRNEAAVSIYKGDEGLSDLNMGHLQSAAGTYRRGRIDNKR